MKESKLSFGNLINRSILLSHKTDRPEWAPVSEAGKGIQLSVDSPPPPAHHPISTCSARHHTIQDSNPPPY